MNPASELCPQITLESIDQTAELLVLADRTFMDFSIAHFVRAQDMIKTEPAAYTILKYLHYIMTTHKYENDLIAVVMPKFLNHICGFYLSSRGKVLFGHILLIGWGIFDKVFHEPWITKLMACAPRENLIYNDEDLADDYRFLVTLSAIFNLHFEFQNIEAWGIVTEFTRRMEQMQPRDHLHAQLSAMALESIANFATQDVETFWVENYCNGAYIHYFETLGVVFHICWNHVNDERQLEFVQSIVDGLNMESHTEASEAEKTDDFAILDKMLPTIYEFCFIQRDHEHLRAIKDACAVSPNIAAAQKILEYLQAI